MNARGLLQLPLLLRRLQEQSEGRHHTLRRGWRGTRPAAAPPPPTPTPLDAALGPALATLPTTSAAPPPADDDDGFADGFVDAFPSPSAPTFHKNSSPKLAAGSVSSQDIGFEAWKG